MRSTRLLPEVVDAPTWRIAKANPAGWLPALAEIARLHELAAPGLADLQPAGDVVALAGDRVIKLWAPIFVPEHRTELAVLERLAGRLPVPVPELEATGQLEGWPYLVMKRLPGRVATAAWPELSVAQRAVVLRDVGAVLAALHAAPRFVCVAVDWIGFVAARRADVVAHHARTPAPRAWLAQLEPWLDAVPSHEAGDRLLHGDLHIGNLMVGADGRMCGLLDFGDARHGAPTFDLATPLLFMADGNPALVNALLDGYGAGPDRSEWPRTLLAWALLHPCSDMTRLLPPPWPEDLDALALRSFPIACPAPPRIPGGVDGGRVLDLGVLAVSLAMDATAAAVGVGAGARSWRPILAAAALFGLFQAGMSGLGWWGGAVLGEVAAAWDHWIAFGLLAAVGLRTMHTAWTKADDAPAPVTASALLVLAFATSVDALAAGVTLPVIGVPAAPAVAAVGIVTAALSLAGGQLGRRAGDRLGGRLELAGGLVLILLGCKILAEHLQAH